MLLCMDTLPMTMIIGSFIPIMPIAMNFVGNPDGMMVTGAIGMVLTIMIS